MKPRESQHIGNFLDLNFFTLPSGHNNYYYDIMFLLFIPLSSEVGGAKHQYSFHALHTSCMNQNSRMHTKQFQFPLFNSHVSLMDLSIVQADSL